MDTLRAVMSGACTSLPATPARCWRRSVGPSCAAASVIAAVCTSATQRLLVLEGARLDERAKQRLEQVLAQSQTLETVYQFREQLRESVGADRPSQDALLKSLQDWCQQAEATGIQALETFARNLRGYTLSPAAPSRRLSMVAICRGPAPWRWFAIDESVGLL